MEHPPLPAERRRSRPVRARARRRSRPSPSARLRVLAGFLLLTLALAVPPVRALGAAAWGRVMTAVAAARAAEAREAEVRRFARQYGIDQELAGEVLTAARAEGMEPELAFRLVRVESAFRETAESPVGALGLTQLMPATAAELQPGITRDEILRREVNLRLGFRYFGRLLRYYDGDVDLALHAYNRGLGTVDRIRARGGDPANGYASMVLGKGGASPVRRVERDSSDSTPPRTIHEMAPARLGGGM